MRLNYEEVRSLSRAGLSYKRIAEIDGSVKRSAVAMLVERVERPHLDRARKLKFIERHPGVFAGYQRRYRQINPGYVQAQAQYSYRWKEKNPVINSRHKASVRETHKVLTEPLAVNSGVLWSDAEVEFLRAHGTTLTIVEMASQLGRSYSSIQMAAFTRGISLYGEEKCLSGKQLYKGRVQSNAS